MISFKIGEKTDGAIKSSRRLSGLYSLYDVKAGVYNSPVLFRNDDEALRVMSDSLSSSNMSLVSSHPEDFSLFRIGHFDDETGEILLPAKICKVCDVCSLVSHSKEYSQ